MSTYPPINPVFPDGGQAHQNDTTLLKDQLNKDLFNEYERTMQAVVQKLETGEDPGHHHSEISAGYWGQERFRSSSGIRINHDKNLPFYTVQVTPITNPANPLGDIYVEFNNSNEFTVYNTGPNNTSSFRWVLRELEKVDYDISGSTIFGSDIGKVIEHNYPFIDHIMYVMPSQNTQGLLGDVWVNRSSIIDIIYNSGSGMSNLNYRIEILDDVEQWAVMNFASLSGVSIAHSLSTANFDLFIIPEEDPSGYLGEVWVDKTISDFTVFNSGPATTRFLYFVSSIDHTEYMRRGRANFSSTSGTVIQHNLDTLDYDFMLMPIENPNGYLGEYYVVKGRNIATVYNTGPAVTLFDYRIEAIHQ